MVQHNVDLIKQRTEKMVFLAEEQVSEDEYEHSSSNSSHPSLDEESCEMTTRHKASVLAVPIGPNPSVPGNLNVNEPSAHDSESNADLDDINSNEEAKLGLKLGKNTSSNPRVVGVKQGGNSRKRNTSF